MPPAAGCVTIFGVWLWFAGTGLASAATEADAAAPATAPWDHWLVAGLNAAALAGFLLWWRWMGRTSRQAEEFVPSPSERLPVAAPAADQHEWRERALAAESREARATALLRARLLPQLARWMMTEVVQRLVTQRSELANCQRQAEQEVADLEQRLEKLQSPLGDRLKAYEKRIAELETELSRRDEENRELIEAKLALARKKLESERARQPLNWN
jgi:hypothetical protein